MWALGNDVGSRGGGFSALRYTRAKIEQVSPQSLDMGGSADDGWIGGGSVKAQVYKQMIIWRW